MRFSYHATQQMAEREITPSEVAEAVANPTTTYQSNRAGRDDRTVMLSLTTSGRRLKIAVLTADPDYVVTVATETRSNLMSRMMISFDTEVGAYYVRLVEGPVARTVHISDDVLIDLDADGQVHGLELLCAPSLLTPDERDALTSQFPAAAAALAELEQLIRPPLSA